MIGARSARVRATRPVRSRSGARLGAATVTVLGALGALGAAACDPCAGVVACTGSPRLSVSGQIVDRGDPTSSPGDPQSGANIPEATPVSGVRIEVIPTGGVATNATSATAVTGSDGWWTATLAARDTGAVTADVVVTPPGDAGYRVRAVPLRASTMRGDGNVLGRWTRQLYLTVLGEVIVKATGERVVGARVTATRSGGVDIAPTRNTQNPMVTTGGGRFLFDVRPLADGPVVQNFVIARDGFDPVTVRNVTLQPRHEWVPPDVDGAIIFYLAGS